MAGVQAIAMEGPSLSLGSRHLQLSLPSALSVMQNPLLHHWNSSWKQFFTYSYARIRKQPIFCSCPLHLALLVKKH
jgi:hypothetical protein